MIYVHWLIYFMIDLYIYRSKYFLFVDGFDYHRRPRNWSRVHIAANSHCVGESRYKSENELSEESTKPCGEGWNTGNRADICD